MRQVLVILGIVMLGVAVALRNGLYTPGAAGLATVAGMLVVGGWLVQGWKRTGVGDDANAGETPASPSSLLRVMSTVGMGVNGWLLLTAPLLNDVAPPYPIWAWACWMGAVVCAMGAVWVPLRGMRWMLLGGCVFAGMAGVWTIRSNPSPSVDVFLFQQEGCAALLRGENPWAMRYANPYPAEQSWVYGEGVVREDGRLDFGYPYLPVTLVAVLPGYLAMGDYRYAMLLWVVVPVVLVGWRASRELAMGLGLLLTFPRLPMVVEWGWSEPVSVGLFVLAARWRAAEWVVAVSKQYLLPLMLICARRWREGDGVPSHMGETPMPQTVLSRRVGGFVFGATALVTVAMVLWSPGEFWKSAIALQFRQPFRSDSLSLTALVYAWSGVKVSSLVALGVTGVLVIVMAWRRAPLVIAGAVVLPVFFLLSKQAFMNYWFLVYGVWCLSLGVVARGVESSAGGTERLASEPANLRQVE